MNRALLILLLMPLAAAQTYRVTDLGTLGGSTSQALGINDLGQVVGESLMPDNVAVHAFLWSKQGGATDIGALGGNFSAAQAINNQGQVVGYSAIAGGREFVEHAFLWTAGEGIEDLGTLPGYDSSIALGISDLGQVVGVSYSSTNTSNQRAFLWTHTGGMQGFVNGSLFASGINNAGQVVGIGVNLDAALWTKRGTTTDLGTLGGSFSVAAGLNTFSQVVGFSPTTGNTDTHAFLWTKAGGIKDLGTLGGDFSSAHGINALGQIVGDSDATTGGFLHAFLWTNGGGMRDLNTLILAGSGWVLSEATGINLQGQIVGTGSVSGEVHGFLLTPKK